MVEPLSAGRLRKEVVPARVGSYRVLFRLEGNQISVCAVKDRKEAYE